MKNIYVLPTDKPSRLIIYSTLLNEYRLLDEPISDWKHKKCICITSNETKVKENDWWIDIITNSIFKVTEEDVLSVNEDGLPDNFKKIILITDQDLIEDGVQAITGEFLEWFVKNPSCEKVEVELEIGSLRWSGSKNTYKIIIPKEEPTEK